MSDRTLLIAYDGSMAARSAMRAAGALFPRARAVVVTVQPEPMTVQHAVARIAIPDDLIAGGIEALNRAEARAVEATAAEGARLADDMGLSAGPRTTEGSPWRAILRHAAESAADVVVCGSRGLGAFSRVALGSTSSGLLLHADVPVLVVPEGGGSLSGPLVIGYDGSDHSGEAIAGAGRLLSGQEAVVVNVWERPALSHDLDGYFRSISSDLAEQGATMAREHGLEARPEAIEAAGSAWHGLLAAARASGAAAVIVGRRGRGGLSSTLLGSVSAGLIHNADVPVLVVPSPPAGNH